MEKKSTNKLVSLKKWKKGNSFDNRFLTTCPLPNTVEGSTDRPVEERFYVSN